MDNFAEDKSNSFPVGTEFGDRATHHVWTMRECRESLDLGGNRKLVYILKRPGEPVREVDTEELGEHYIIVTTPG